MKRYLLAITLFLSITAVSNAQDYNTGIGLRGGAYNGITVKHFLGANAIEGILTTRYSGFKITGLYEIHKMTAFGVDRLNWYYGFGAHIGFYDPVNATFLNDGDRMVLGIDGILGLEYNFVEVPFNISLDWKPAINIIGYDPYWFDGGGLSVRYIF